MFLNFHLGICNARRSSPSHIPNRNIRHYLRRWYLVLLAISILTFGQSAQALTYVYDNNPGTPQPIPNDLQANLCLNGLQVPFLVTDSFNVSSITVGLNITHPSRGEVLALLVGPGGILGVLNTIVQVDLLDTHSNYDVLIGNTNETLLVPLINDGDDDPVGAPYYNRLVEDVGINNIFAGNAQGLWRLYLCDVNPLGNSGTLNRARLILTSNQSATPVCTSTVSYDWATNGDNNAFTNATVGGVTITQNAPENFGSSSGVGNFQTSTGALGGATGYYRLSMDAPGATDSEVIGDRVQFNFSPPVHNLSFALLNIDLGADFEDQGSVFATDSLGNPVPFRLVEEVGPNVDIAGNTAEGDVYVPTDSSTAANANVRFDGPVASLTVEYTQGDQPLSGAGPQRMGISDFSFCAFDYGDAGPSYGTELSGDGARHVLGARNLYLGVNPPDGESGTSNSSTDATIDDITSVGANDEDGVSTFPASSTSDGQYTVDVAYTNNTGNNAMLCGWIDFDQHGLLPNGTFDSDERACNAVSGGSGTTSLVFNVPTEDRANTGQFFARFRIASNATEAQSPTGLAANGEVEDYLTTAITTLPVTLASVDSHVTKAGLRVDWTTATETRNVGFQIYGRKGDESAWQLLTPEMIPSAVIDSLEPQRYSAAVSGDVDELLIEGWDSHGQTERHGPFTVGQSYGFDAVSHAQPIDWAAIAAENAGTSKSLARTRRMSSATTGQADALLWVTEPGIQRISFAALQAAGADFSLAPVAQLALTDDGQGAPRYVLDANANGLFDDGDSLEFVGTIADTLYSGRNAYRLRLDPSQVKAVKNVPLLKARNAAPEVFPDRLVFERQKAYSFTSPIDPWYDQWLTAYGRSASLSRSFALPGYAGGDATLHLTLWGVTDWPGVGDDHHLRVKVNEQTLADFSFDGNRDASRDFTVPEGALTASGNTLTLEAPGDTGFAYDIQAFDGFTVAYARQTQAQDGAWRGTIPTNVTSPVQVSGFQGETVAWKGAQRRVGDGSVILKGAGAWQAADGRALQTPIVQAAIPQPAQTPERGAVDYLIVSHPQFLDTPALTQLAALQESRGYSTAVLDVQSLYAAYSDFAVDPEALRAYLRQARPPFVLLVGGDSYDYRDYLGLASQSFIPTFYAATDSLVTQAPADNRFVDYNDNGIPQAAIGRLPVRTVAELTAVADKLVHYQPPTRAVLAAGPSDGGRQFAQVSEEQAQPLLNRFVTQTFYVDDEGLPNAQAALLQALDQDGALVSYVGHSSFRIWGLNPSHGILLWADDARRLTNPTPHLVTQWGCWNTYFVDPNQDTLANGFLLQDHGAAGVLGATALTDLNLLRDFGTEFFRQYAQQPTLGEALRAAQRRYITGNPKAASALRGFVLLGDPATELK
ncbi:MAG: hypothetical protein H6970_13805 [Gammaproteobacteria bacterium]|nr:hypothetical protein [Gammaproteobacteria bacterium]